MKKKTIPLLTLILLFLYMTSETQAIGISPARWTSDITEFNCTFNGNMSYNLSRPSSQRYSIFSVSDAAGMTGTVTGFSASGGVEYQNDSSIVIDWQSEALMSVGSITATINIQSPTSWDCPAEPGGSGYFADLVCHSEAFDSGSGIVAGVAAVSQIALYRNYAPRIYGLSHPETINIGQSAQFNVQFEDKMISWFSRFPDRDYNGGPWLTYAVDWNGDGIVDLNGDASFDEEAVFDLQYNIYRWTSGIQLSTLSLDHIYNTAGNYTATIQVRDGAESAILEIPIQVAPEPATLVLLSLGGLFLRKRR